MYVTNIRYNIVYNKCFLILNLNDYFTICFCFFEKLRLRPRLEFVNQEKFAVMGAEEKGEEVNVVVLGDALC